jgi:hypothetical protein
MSKQQEKLFIYTSGKISSDINECLRNNGRGECQDECRNLFGKYECSCENLPNTKLSPDGHSCEDAGECSNNNGNCSHICLSTMKRVFCLCPEGLELANDDDKTCKGKWIKMRLSWLCFVFINQLENICQIAFS